MTPPDARARSPWLSLGEASRLLGVTPGTLRRWSDGGQVAFFVTPGGHRRFPRAVIEALVPAATPDRAGIGGAGVDGDAMARAYRRRGAVSARQAGWVARLSDTDRQAFRDRGRALVALLVQHLDGDGSTHVLKDAASAAEEYGRTARHSGASLADTVQGFLLFRSPFLGELARQAAARGLSGKEATALLVRAEQAMDKLLVRVMSGHAGEA